MCLPALLFAYAASSPKRLLGQLEIDEQFSKALNLVTVKLLIFTLDKT